MTHTVTYIVTAKGFDYSDDMRSDYPGCETPMDRAEMDVEQVLEGVVTLDELLDTRDVELKVLAVVEDKA